KTAFARHQANLAFPGTSSVAGNVMGGCMGCHGVAQVKGFSFSFVFLEGQLSAGMDTEADFNVAPLAPATPAAHLPAHHPRVFKREKPRPAQAGH
ncbi:MAG: hypothetical protein JOZ15_19125, partial [Acidobacteria bacterium]|nr:hypothetical protein [Acidobacteriota bacterium]